MKEEFEFTYVLQRYEYRKNFIVGAFETKEEAEEIERILMEELHERSELNENNLEDAFTTYVIHKIPKLNKETGLKRGRHIVELRLEYEYPEDYEED